MSTPPQYEFNQGQNALMTELADKMQAVSFIWRLVGFLGVGLSAVLAFHAYREHQWNWPLMTWATVGVNTFVALVNLFIAGWTGSAGRSFRGIAGTQGSDITHLMNAVRSLLRLFSLVHTLMTVAIIAFLAGIGLALYHLFLNKG